MKVVVIGGGTGTSTILRGLKRVTNDITAIICTTDDGGGSGILREDYGMIPPGDFSPIREKNLKIYLTIGINPAHIADRASEIYL